LSAQGLEETTRDVRGGLTIRY